MNIGQIFLEKHQTLAYYGCDKSEFLDFIAENGLLGIDRAVPFGHTADFGLIWDGYDLISSMSRVIVAV